MECYVARPKAGFLKVNEGLEGPDAIAVAPVPLPGSIWLMLRGIAGIGAAAVKRRAG